MSSLRVLQIEDDEDHARIVERELRRGGYETQCTRVDTAPDLRAALATKTFDLITSDYSLPRFDAPSALSVVREFPLEDVPFIIVSGTIPDTAASSAMKAGAHDFVSKSDLRRLVPAVRRELKEAQARSAGRLAEARFRTLAQSLDGTVVVIDRELTVGGVHGRRLLLDGHARAEVVGASVRALFRAGEQDEVEACCRRVLAGAGAAEEVLHFGRRHGDGAVVIEVTISPMVEAEGVPTGLVAFVRDVTEQRRLQAQVVASDRMATIGTLAAGIAHEINNPLSALLSNLHMLARDVQRLADGQALTPPFLSELTELVGDSNAAAAMVRTIAADLRTFARHSEDAPGPVAVKSVLESALRMARCRVEARAHVVRDYRDVPPVVAVESSLGQVFLNLLVNAAQAIPDGGRDRHEVRVSLSEERATRHVVVGITDTGVGISDAAKERLFSPFFTTKPSGVGTGLGLSICKRIIASFGGGISVESTLGQGATFTVRLRVADAPAY